MLEAGLLGLVLIVAFLVWYVRSLRRNWTTAEAALGRAGSIAIAVMLLHSLVDYPIRTAAIAAMCALCLSLMAPAPEAEPPRRRKSES